MRLDPIQRALQDVLCCLRCSGQLVLDELASSVHCLSCQSTYPVHDGILLLVKDHDLVQREEQAFRNALAARYFDRHPEEVLGIVAEHHCSEVMGARASRFRKSFRDGDWILDVGIGFGWHWLEAGLSGMVLGIDLSLGNLRLASRLLQNRQDVVLVLADVAALPLRDRTITGLWSVQTFQHLPGPALESALREVDRVMRDEFQIEVYNLNPSLARRIGYSLKGTILRRRSAREHFYMNWLSAKQWAQVWEKVRAGATTISRGYSELFFHPEVGLRPKPYPIRWERNIGKYGSGLAALFARQSQLNIRSANKAVSP